MNRDEVSDVLARLSSWYPNHDMPAATLLLWAGDLAAMDYASSIEAVDQWHRSQPWFPSISEFLGLSHRIAERRSVGSTTRPELPPAPYDGPSAQESIAAARAALANAKPWREDPVTHERIELPAVPGFQTIGGALAQKFGLQ